MKRETFNGARLRLFFALADRGWKISTRALRVPWAEPTDGRYRISFRPQAVYLNDHSLMLEMRGLSIDDLIRSAEFRWSQLQKV
jgi:hypothetical protein